MIKVKRLRRVGDKVMRNDTQYEIVGIHGNGCYGIRFVNPDTGNLSKEYYTMNLGRWVMDVVSKRPYPFEESV